MRWLDGHDSAYRFLDNDEVTWEGIMAPHWERTELVRQELWAASIELHPGKPGAITVTCVIAREIDAPKGTKPVEWRLLANRSAPTLNDVIELIDWYRDALGTSRCSSMY